ncbi:MAG: trigger factor [Planctomycetaceae bacterium]|nr:trigger factor [Planctomycetaceae bacterium]
MSESEIDDQVGTSTLNETPKETLNSSLDIQTISACERKIVVTIPRKEIDRYFSKEFDDIVENANVPGFRKGRAPKKLVEKRYRKMVEDRVKGSLIMDSISQLHENDKLTPISEPDFDYEAVVLPDEGPMVFEFRLEVRPEFELPEWRGLTIEKPVRDFSSEDVDRALERVLTDFGKLNTTEDAAVPGDYIVTKLTFYRDGNEISSADEETIRIRPTLSFHDGSITGFDKLMTGVRAGDVREAEAILSEDAPNAEVRGQKVQARFEIKEVKKLELPELTGDFIKTLGDYDTVGDLKDAVRSALERQLEYEQRRRTRQQVTDTLTVSASWELPPALLERQSRRELQRMIIELRRSGFTDEQIMPQINYLRQNSKVTTAQALKEHFILEKIAEVEGITETEADYDTEIMLIAAQQGESPRRIRAQYEKQGQMDILRNAIIERKVLNLIFEKAKMVEVPYEIEGITEEALDHAAGGGSEADLHGDDIHEASEDDLHAANREMLEKRELGINDKE